MSAWQVDRLHELRLVNEAYAYRRKQDLELDQALEHLSPPEVDKFVTAQAEDFFEKYPLMDTLPQHLHQQPFHYDEPHTWDTDLPTATMSRSQERAFVRAMYDNTQRFLASNGLKPDDKIVLHRGFTSKERLTLGWKYPTIRNAASSWTFDKDVAEEFALLNYIVGHVNYAVKTEVPVSSILSTALTGFGCINEAEFTVLSHGGLSEVTVKEFL